MAIEQTGPFRHLTVTFVWDEDTDSVAVKHNGEVVWRESTFDKLDQYFKHFPPTGQPVVIETCASDCQEHAGDRIIEED